MQKPQKSAKMIFSATVFSLGLLALAGGLVFLILNFTKTPRLRDAEYLVEVGAWEREDAPSVVWQFTGIGSGQLTTNAHLNDYDFIWALDGNTIKTETSWLYTLNDEYVYELDQDAKTFTLTSSDGETFIFIPSSAGAANTTDTTSPADTPEESAGVSTE